MSSIYSTVLKIPKPEVEILSVQL